MLVTPVAPVAPTMPDVRVAERRADLGAELRIDDLGLRMDQRQRLEVVAARGRVEHEVVGPPDRLDGSEREQL